MRPPWARGCPVALLLALGCLPGDVPPDDTSPPDDTDLPLPGGDTDAPRDTAPPLPPPLDWGPGLVDITGPLATAEGLVPHGGEPGVQPPVGPQPAPIAVGDLDGDGVPEVVAGLGTFGAGGAPVHQVYRYEGGQLVRAPALEEALPALRDAVVGILDVDGDGHPDLVGAHGDTAVAFGRGDGTWDEVLDLQLPEGNWFTLGTFAFHDVDQDGWLDMLVGDVGCNDGVVPALRTGLRAWSLRPDLTRDTEPVASSAGVGVVPLVDGRTVVYGVGTACDRWAPHPGFYEILPEDPPTLAPVLVDPPDPAWRQDPVGSGLAVNTLLMPMGMNVTDLDGDGRFDVVLSLAAPWMILWRQQADGSFEDVTLEAGLDLRIPGDTHRHPWGAATPDLDLDGHDDLLVTIGDDVTSFALQAGVPLRNRAWRRLPEGGWSDEGAALGLDVVGSFHAVLLTDLDADGDADPAIVGYGSPARLYRNEITTPNHGLSLRLRGTTSNHLGVGAVVEVESDAVGLRRHLVGDIAQHYGIPEPLVFAGLGPDPVARTLRVRWPSGFVQELTDVPAGQLVEVVEPWTVRVSPDGRHVPLGETATVEVTPRRPDGTPDPSIQVTLEVSDGGVAGPPSREGDTWRFAVSGPDAPGTTRLTVKLDGVPVAVRPRLWWTAP